MTQLEPCPHCQRHVRIDALSCPFCSAELSTAFAEVKPRVLPRKRLGRAALFAFGVSAAAAVLPGCGDDDDDDDDGEDADGGSSGDSGGQSNGADNQGGNGNVQPVYGAPAPDGGGLGGDDNTGATQGSTVDASSPNNEPDAGGVVALYGAAPTD